MKWFLKNTYSKATTLLAVVSRFFTFTKWRSIHEWWALFHSFIRFYRIKLLQLFTKQHVANDNSTISFVVNESSCYNCSESNTWPRSPYAHRVVAPHCQLHPFRHLAPVVLVTWSPSWPLNQWSLVTWSNVAKLNFTQQLWFSSSSQWFQLNSRQLKKCFTVTGSWMKTGIIWSCE